jgi:membrane protease YdiL (CAAX protease family)
VVHESRPSYPTVNQAFILILATLVLTSLLALIWKSGPAVPRMLVLELLIGVPVLVFVLSHHINLKNIFLLSGVKARIWLLGIPVGAGLALLLNEVNWLVQTILPVPDRVVQGLNDMFTVSSVAEGVLLALVVVVAGAIVEEAIFRGFFFVSLYRVADTTQAVLVSAFVFAAAHFNPWSFVGLLILGVTLGVIAWRTRSIFPGMVVHGIINGLGMGLIYIRESQVSWLFYKNHFHPVWIILGAGLTLWGFLRLYRWTSAAGETEKGNT